MAPHPSDAPAIPLSDLVPFMNARCDADEAFEVIDADRRIIRLTETKDVRLPDGSAALALLFCLGDRDKADPGATNFQTGAVRIFETDEDEVGGLSVHALIKIDPTEPKGHLYRAVIEDVTGFGRTPIQAFLRSQFKIICDDHNFEYRREDKRSLKTRPMVELAGHASEKLKDSLNSWRLLNIEMIDYEEVDLGTDEGKFLKTARRALNIAVSKALPKSEQMTLLEQARSWARGQGYATMRVRWKGPNNARPQSAKVDTAKADAGEALFNRTDEVKVASPLSEVCATISDELITEMQKAIA